MDRKKMLAGVLEQLESGYGCEIRMYSQVRELSRRQAALLQDGSDPQKLLQLSSDKECLLKNITEIDKALDPARSVVASECDLIADGRLNRLHAQLDELCILIDEIRLLEMESYCLLTALAPKAVDVEDVGAAFIHGEKAHVASSEQSWMMN